MFHLFFVLIVLFEIKLNVAEDGANPVRRKGCCEFISLCFKCMLNIFIYYFNFCVFKVNLNVAKDGPKPVGRKQMGVI